MAERVKEPPKWMTQPRKPAWVPANYTTADVGALKATWEGTATPDEMRQALQWIIAEAGQYGEISYRSEKDGGALETAFAEGRRFVAQQVQKLIGLDARLVAKLREDENAAYNPANTKHDRSGS